MQIKIPVMRTTRFCVIKQRKKAVPHFTSQTFAMGVSLQHRALLVKLYYKNDDCARVVLQKFRTLKGIKEGVGPMSVMGLKQIMQNFEKIPARLMCNVVEGQNECIRR